MAFRAQRARSAPPAWRRITTVKWGAGLCATTLCLELALHGAPVAAQSTICTPDQGQSSTVCDTSQESATPYPTATLYPTATFYPTATAYPTFTPQPADALATPVVESSASATPTAPAPAVQPAPAPAQPTDAPSTPRPVGTATAVLGTPSAIAPSATPVHTASTTTAGAATAPAAATATAAATPAIPLVEFELAPSGDVRSGYFYPQAGGGRGGYVLTNEFWDLVQKLGGVSRIGYPASQVWTGSDGFLYQVMQGALLQWSPGTGARLGNTFQQLEEAGQDDWLLSIGVPRPIKEDGSTSLDDAIRIRLGWLTQPQIAERFWSAGDRAVELYGLPMSRPEPFGPFIAQRFQRVAFQYWVESVPGMPSVGSVSVVLGGDLLKQANLVPALAQLPVLPPARRAATPQ